MIKKSPLNYSGSKDKIVKDIIKYIPEDTKVFVDAFGGAFNVGINVDTEKVVYNEINPYVVGVIKMLLQEDKEGLIEQIENTIERFNLQARNQTTYNAFRNYYNDVEKTPLNLYILSLYSFSNIIRFNKKEKFNASIGKQEYNSTIIDRILNFTPEAEKVDMLNLSYKDIPLDIFDSKTLFYFDPPYITTQGIYNETNRLGNGWCEEDEIEFLKYLEKIDNLGYKFILSNLFSFKGNNNEYLINFVNENNFNKTTIGKTRNREEQLIFNFDI